MKTDAFNGSGDTAPHARVPGMAIHTDPCARMITAAAQVYHLPVVTTDPLFARDGIEVIA